MRIAYGNAVRTRRNVTPVYTETTGRSYGRFNFGSGSCPLATRSPMHKNYETAITNRRPYGRTLIVPRDRTKFFGGANLRFTLLVIYCKACKKEQRSVNNILFKLKKGIADDDFTISQDTEHDFYDAIPMPYLMYL